MSIISNSRNERSKKLPALWMLLAHVAGTGETIAVCCTVPRQRTITETLKIKKIKSHFLKQKKRTITIICKVL